MIIQKYNFVDILDEKFNKIIVNIEKNGYTIENLKDLIYFVMALDSDILKHIELKKEDIERLLLLSEKLELAQINAKDSQRRKNEACS